MRTYICSLFRIFFVHWDAAGQFHELNSDKNIPRKYNELHYWDGRGGNMTDRAWISLHCQCIMNKIASRARTVFQDTYLVCTAYSSITVPENPINPHNTIIRGLNPRILRASYGGNAREEVSPAQPAESCTPGRTIHCELPQHFSSSSFPVLQKLFLLHSDAVMSVSRKWHHREQSKESPQSEGVNRDVSRMNR